MIIESAAIAILPGPALHIMDLDTHKEVVVRLTVEQAALLRDLLNHVKVGPWPPTQTITMVDPTFWDPET